MKAERTASGGDRSPAADRLVVAVLGLAVLAFPTLAESPAPDTAVPDLVALADTVGVRVDGVLDDPLWQRARRAETFVQREPEVGAPASESTFLQAGYDDSTLYLAVTCNDSEPDRIIAQEMRREISLGGDDSVAILLDTFHDHRNGYLFELNANGARRDLLITDEGQDIQASWDGVWFVATRRTATGWTAELAIPFTTLLFDPTADTWGLNVRRIIRRKNEEVYWSPLPLDAGITRVSLAGHLSGLELPKPGVDLQLKPFAVADSRDDRFAEGQPDEEGEIGLDAKWGITRSLTLNATVNTDFAETEVDALQVNLTRFSLFFPEKREFFLENAGLFDFGFGSSALGPPLLKVFHSRRIGIGPGGREIPLEWGTRLTGRVGPWGIGALHVASEGLDLDGQQLASPDRSSVLRLTRNVGERSRLGILATERDPEGRGSSRTYGIDAYANPLRQLRLSGFATRSESADGRGDGEAWGASASWTGSRWLASLSTTEVDEDFRPELGFLLRQGVRQYLPNVQFLPRPDWRGVRSLDFQILGEIVTDLEGEIETVSSSATLFGTRWQSGAYTSVFYDWNFEDLSGPFEIAAGVEIPAGDYVFPAAGVFFITSSRRRLSADGFVRYGDFYNGDRYDHELRLITRPSRFVGTETVWSYNDISLPSGDVEVSLIRQRVSLSLRPDFTIDTYLQFNAFADRATANVRLRWTYRPGADLFLVYNHNWDAPSVGDLSSRDSQILAKVTYRWDV
ncbi:MAG: DUF5916 domain-containing protein [Acidobacteriota bacterium]